MRLGQWHSKLKRRQSPLVQGVVQKQCVLTGILTVGIEFDVAIIMYQPRNTVHGIAQHVFGITPSQSFNSPLLLTQMGLDTDFVYGRDRLYAIERLFAGLPHGERGWMASRLGEFYENLRLEASANGSLARGVDRGILES